MLISLFLVFALPVMIGIVLYVSDWRPGGSSYGELLRPPQPLNFPVLKTSQGEPVDALVWKSKWHLVYIAPASCDTECRNGLHAMRQIHASLAKEIDRLERVWLVDGPLLPEAQALQSQYPDMLVLSDAAALTKQLNTKMANAGGRIYLVDPLGNLVMSYPRGGDPYGIRKDLMKLLKYSWTG
jgi:cytochrome oxidase Cu insertion factor (SCO1/SenC/PrrC family)